MSCAVLVVLCAVGAVSSLPISQKDNGHTEGSLEKTICFRYQETPDAETNHQVKPDDWLIIRLGKSQPTALNYRILTLGERSEQSGSRTKLVNSNLAEEGSSPQHRPGIEQRVEGKLIPASSGSREIGVISATNANCSLSSENKEAGDSKVISANSNKSTEAKYSKDSPAVRPKAPSSNISNERDANNTMTNSNNSVSNMNDTSTNAENSVFNSTGKNLIHTEIVTDRSGIVIDVLSIEEDSGSTTDGLFPLTRPEDREGEEAVQNSKKGSDEGYNKSRSRESSVNGSNASNFESETWTSTVNSTLSPEVVINDENSDASNSKPKTLNSTVNSTLSPEILINENADASNSEPKTWNTTVNSTVPPEIIMHDNGNASNSKPETLNSSGNSTLPPGVVMNENGNASNLKPETLNSTVNSTLPPDIIMNENGNTSNSETKTFNSTVNSTSAPGVLMNENGNASNLTPETLNSTVNSTVPPKIIMNDNGNASNSKPETSNSTVNSTLPPDIIMNENGNASNSDPKTWNSTRNSTLSPGVVMNENGNASNSDPKTWDSTVNSTLPPGVLMNENGNASNLTPETLNSTVNSTVPSKIIMNDNGNASNSKPETSNSTVNSTLPPDIIMNENGNASNSDPKTWNSTRNSTLSPGVVMNENGNASNSDPKTLNSTVNSTLPPEIITNENGSVIGVLSEENTDNSTTDYEYETAWSNGTDSPVAIRNLIANPLPGENNTSIVETADHKSINVTNGACCNNSSESSNHTLPTSYTETSPYSNSSNDRINSTIENFSGDADNDQTTLITLETPLSSSAKFNSSHDQINNRIGIVTESIIETELVTATSESFLSDNETTNHPEIQETIPSILAGPSTSVLSVIDSTTISQEMHAFNTSEQTTITTPAVSGDSSEETHSHQLTITTTKPVEENFRLEPSTMETGTTAGIAPSQPDDSTEEEIIQNHTPLSSSPATAVPAYNLITPSTTDSESTSEQIQRLLPVPTAPIALQDWENFNNFTIIFPTRRTYFMSPYYYNPYEQGFYYMPLDPRYIQPREFVPHT